MINDQLPMKLYALLLLAVIFITVSCSGGPPVPFPAFDFTKEDMFTGDEIHLEDMKGQHVLIYFFASW
jgi:hypothetical protein